MPQAAGRTQGTGRSAKQQKLLPGPWNRRYSRDPINCIFEGTWDSAIVFGSGNYQGLGFTYFFSELFYLFRNSRLRFEIRIINRHWIIIKGKQFKLVT